MAAPQYFPHPNSKYRGNPYIEGLGLPLSTAQFYANCEIPFQCDLDLAGVDESLHSYFIRTAIDQLAEVYTSPDEAYRLYDQIRRMIEAGYARRNPIGADVRRILAAIDRDKAEPWKASHVLELELSVQYSLLLLGLSGRGKSTMVRQICKQLHQTLEHSCYTDHQGNEFVINRTQVTYLYVEVHDRRGQKALLLNLLESLDAITGESYSHAHRSRSVNELISVVQKSFIGHGVGLLILDEAQNLAKSAKSEVISNNEKTTMKFLEELFNRVGIPLMFVGTLATMKLFESEMTLTRRATKNGFMQLVSCELESSFWHRFIRLICQTRLLKNQTTSEDVLRQHIHYLSAGIPAIATSLVRAALSYLTHLKPQDQDLSIAALDHTFNREFKILNPALTALRKGDYYQFEDLSPMLMLESVASGHEVAQQAQPQSGKNLLQGEARISNKPQKIEVKQQKTLEQLSPDLLLGQLGYHLDKGQRK
ncbi:AAA family ATPase [Aeromonas allosaccharophila]|uniref:AAA family ATPase n=3 Tax=Aeromonas TaxID=642 RepID=UPI0039872EDC